MIAQTTTCGYTEPAPEKNGAGIGVPMISGGQPPSERFFYVRVSPFMGRLYGVSSDTPVPLTRYANLYSLARPDWRQGRQVSETCKRRHVMSNHSIATSVASFSFEKFTVRAINRNGEIWFVAADVGAVLGLTNVRASVALLDDDEKGVNTIDTPSGKQEMSIINESGLYALILRSRKPEAKRFRKWVTSEVLPVIRKTGTYALPNRTIDKAQQGDLATLIAERFPSGKDRPYAWSRFNNHFRLASYKDLPASRFEEACEYIRTMPELVPALPANYNYPLESARPKRTIGRTAWMTVDVLLDERNPAPEFALLEALEKAGYDVEGVRLRIESMHYQLEEYRKFRRRLKDLCEDVSVNRGPNVNFPPSGNVTARIAND